MRKRIEVIRGNDAYPFLLRGNRVEGGLWEFVMTRGSKPHPEVFTTYEQAETRAKQLVDSGEWAGVQILEAVANVYDLTEFYTKLEAVG